MKTAWRGDEFGDGLAKRKPPPGSGGFAIEEGENRLPVTGGDRSGGRVFGGKCRGRRGWPSAVDEEIVFAHEGAMAAP